MLNFKFQSLYVAITNEIAKFAVLHKIEKLI